MEATKQYSVFGSHGFIGSEVCKNDNFVHNEPDAHNFRNRLTSAHPDIVYLISTTHNYHILDNDPYTDIGTNLSHLISVLQANRLKYGDKFSITFVSSWFVYGKVSKLPVDEAAICDPKGFYSITKRTAEQLLASYCDTWGIDYKIIRLSNVLGLDDKKVSARKNALQYMIRELVIGNSVQVYEGSNRRDFIHVSDAAEAIRRVARYGRRGEIYNAGSGYPNDIGEILASVARKLDIEGKITTCPTPKFHSQVQIKDFWMDNSKIKFELGWKPVRIIEDIIDEIVEGYSDTKG